MSQSGSQITEKNELCKALRNNAYRDQEDSNRIFKQIPVVENRLTRLRGELSEETSLLKVALQIARDAALGTIPLEMGRNRRRGKHPTFTPRAGALGAAVAAENSLNQHRANVRQLKSEIERQEYKLKVIESQRNELSEKIKSTYKRMEKLNCPIF